jgi:hypothetical protein
MAKKFDLAMLKKLFKLEETTDSDTHDNLNVSLIYISIQLMVPRVYTVVQ